MIKAHCCIYHDSIEGLTEEDPWIETFFKVAEFPCHSRKAQSNLPYYNLLSLLSWLFTAWACRSDNIVSHFDTVGNYSSVYNLLSSSRKSCLLDACFWLQVPKSLPPNVSVMTSRRKVTRSPTGKVLELLLEVIDYHILCFMFNVKEPCVCVCLYVSATFCIEWGCRKDILHVPLQDVLVFLLC